MKLFNALRTSIAICGVAILAAALAFAQVPLPCSTFESGLNGWTTENANATTQSGHGGAYADVTDDSGGSNFVAPPSYTGNWLKLVQGCGELCFDINILDDGFANSSNPVHVAFEIKDNAGHRAFFFHNAIVEGTGWQTFCAPIGPLAGGNPPSNGQGTWTLATGTTTADWQTLLQNIQSLKFAVDFAASGAQTEHFQIDNVCFKANTCAKADFATFTACAGQAVTIQNQSTGAISSSWILHGSPNTSTTTSPTVTYNAPGSYVVKLCINGGTAPPLCVTKTIVINPVPAVPVISGPTTTCQNPATYCLTNAQSGVTYAWTINGGTATPATGACTSINWTNVSVGGTISITATNAAGCQTKQKMAVTRCDPHNPCCDLPHFKVGTWTLQYNGGGNYQFTPLISAGPTKRVVVDIISASVTYPSTSCGTPHTFLPAITQVYPVSPFTQWQPVLNSTEAVWSSTTATTLTNVPFPVDVLLPLRSTGCDDTIHFCVKYSVTDAQCRTCEVVRCYDYTRKNDISTDTDPNPN